MPDSVVCRTCNTVMSNKGWCMPACHFFHDIGLVVEGEGVGEGMAMQNAMLIFSSRQPMYGLTLVVYQHEFSQ